MIRITITSDRGEGATKTAMFLARLLGSLGWDVIYQSPVSQSASEHAQKVIESSQPLITEPRKVLIHDRGAAPQQQPSLDMGTQTI